MVHYKLLYFGARGKAEAIRYVLAQAGVDFEDQRVTPDEWPKFKPTTPMGQVPVLFVDGKSLAQSTAIARYLAKEHGLVPSDHWLAAKADMLVDGVNDQYPNLRPFVMSMLKGETEKSHELWNTYKTEHLPACLAMYEKFLTENGGKFFVGDHLSWADLFIAEFIDRLTFFDKGESILSHYKHLLEHVKRIHDLPNIKKYVANRPNSSL